MSDQQYAVRYIDEAGMLSYVESYDPDTYEIFLRGAISDAKLMTRDEAVNLASRITSYVRVMLVRCVARVGEEDKDATTEAENLQIIHKYNSLKKKDKNNNVCKNK